MAKRKPTPEQVEEYQWRNNHCMVPHYIHKEDFEKMQKMIADRIVSLGFKDVIAIDHQAEEALRDICFHLFKIHNCM